MYHIGKYPDGPSPGVWAS